MSDFVNLLRQLLSTLGPGPTPPAPTPPGVPAVTQNYSIFGPQPAPPPRYPGEGPANDPTGMLPGVMHSMPMAYGNLGAIRPFGPGEYVQRAGGPTSVSSEEDITVPVDEQGNYAEQNPHHWLLLPGLWLVNGIPTNVDERTAAQYAKQSGLYWRPFPSSQATDQFANWREGNWEKQKSADTTTQPPLWQYKK